MEIIHGIYSLKPEHKGCVLTIGNFDGVHHGHRMVLDHAARIEGVTPAQVVASLLEGVDAVAQPLPREVS